MSSLAERIKSARIGAGIGEPAELARRAGVKPAAVYQWESGATKSLKAETAIAVADAVHVTTKWLVTGHGPRERTTSAAPSAGIDRDVLRQAVIGAERIIRDNGIAKTITDRGRADMIAAVYSLLAEGIGIERAEGLVTGTLRALSSGTKVS